MGTTFGHAECPLSPKAGIERMSAFDPLRTLAFKQLNSENDLSWVFEVVWLNCFFRGDTPMIRFIAALLLLSLPALIHAQPIPSNGEDGAAPAPPAPPIVVTGEKDPKKKVVCESREETGSLFRKRTCRTVAEAEAETEASRRLLDELTAQQERRQHTKELICSTGRAC